MKIYIAGVGTGYLYANAQLPLRHQPLLFCQPEHFVLNSQNYMDILDRTLAKVTTLKDDMTIEMVLLAGLEEELPCDAKH